jgi:hypothetical protein
MRSRRTVALKADSQRARQHERRQWQRRSPKRATGELPRVRTSAVFMPMKLLMKLNGRKG